MPVTDIKSKKKPTTAKKRKKTTKPAVIEVEEPSLFDAFCDGVVQGSTVIAVSALAVGSVYAVGQLRRQSIMLQDFQEDPSNPGLQKFFQSRGAVR
jgi:hypothetical protein